MKKIVILISVALLSCGFSTPRIKVTRKASTFRELRKDFKDSERLKKTADRVIAAMVATSTYLLTREGRGDLAISFQKEYKANFVGFLSRMDKDLGDHEPLSAYLTMLMKR